MVNPATVAFWFSTLVRDRTIPTDGRLWTCMGPLLIDEIYRLRGAAGS